MRWEWTGTSFAPEGDADGTTMTATEFKDNDPTEPIEAQWTSGTYNVSGAIVKAGTPTCTFTYDDESSGTVETCDSSPNPDASGGTGQFPPQSILAAGSFGLLAGALILRGRR